MAGDKRLETMEEELKLLKGELKQSLASVRDYLLNMELPSSEFSTILEALGNGEGQNVTMSGTLSAPVDNKTQEESQQGIVESEPDEIPPGDNLIDVEEPPEDESHPSTDDSVVSQETESSQEEPMLAEDESDEDIPLDEDVQADEEEPDKDTRAEMPDQPEEAFQPELGLPLESDRIPDEVSLATPKVNMLANLITWVAKVKKEIGYDQLATFLEVYGISGHLSLELKEFILHLAEITAEKPEVVSNPEVWSQAMLTLHGILTGGDAPLHPVAPFLMDTSEEELLTEEEPTEEEEAKEQPLKLKLVFPNGDGKSKEFCINLTPEEDDSDVSSPRRKSESSPNERGD